MIRKCDNKVEDLIVFKTQVWKQEFYFILFFVTEDFFLFIYHENYFVYLVFYFIYIILIISDAILHNFLPEFLFLAFR